MRRPDGRVKRARGARGLPLPGPLEGVLELSYGSAFEMIIRSAGPAGADWGLRRRQIISTSGCNTGAAAVRVDGATTQITISGQ